MRHIVWRGLALTSGPSPGVALTSPPQRGSSSPEAHPQVRARPALVRNRGLRGVFLTSVSGGWRGEAGVAGEVVAPERRERWGKMWEAGGPGTLGHPLPTPGTLSLGSSAKRGGRVVAGSSSSLSSRPPRATLRPTPLRLRSAQSPPARGRARGGRPASSQGAQVVVLRSALEVVGVWSAPPACLALLNGGVSKVAPWEGAVTGHVGL